MTKEQVSGCLFGGAVGDALGMPFEEIPLSKRLELYGNDPVSDFIPGKPYMLRQRIVPAGSVTDDTEMVLATAESIIENNAVLLPDVGRSLLKWIRREQEWLNRGMQSRNIGNTTREAIEKFAETSDPRNCGIPSGGCGAAIRISPVALCCYNDFDLLSTAVLDVSQLTHKNPNELLAEEGALCIAASIRHLLRNGTVEGLLDYLGSLVKIDMFKSQLTILRDGLREGWNVEFAAESLGTGPSYLASEVVPLAIFVFLRNHESFEDTVIEVANISAPAGVDADSIASLAGALSGCYLGVNEIPDRFKLNVEYYQQINSVSEDLHKLIVKYNGKVPYKPE